MRQVRYIKVVGSRLRSHEQKTYDVILSPLRFSQSMTITVQTARPLSPREMVCKHDDGKFHTSHLCHLPCVSKCTHLWVVGL